MQSANEQLQGGQELNYISQRDAYAGTLFGRVIQAVNTLAKNAGVAAVGKLVPPPRIDSIQVQGTQSGGILTCPSENLQWTLMHNQSVNKGVHYFSEISTEPNFLQPHVIDHGTTRSGFMSLPTYMSDGATKQTYYLRSYAQYPGSDPSEPTVLGGLGSAVQIKMTPHTVTGPVPTSVNVGGTIYPIIFSAPGPIGTSAAASTLPSSTGSGTASPTGTQGAKGLGTVLTRPAPSTKRSV